MQRRSVILNACLTFFDLLKKKKSLGEMMLDFVFDPRSTSCTNLCWVITNLVHITSGCKVRIRFLLPF